MPASIETGHAPGDTDAFETRGNDVTTPKLAISIMVAFVVLTIFGAYLSPISVDVRSYFRPAVKTFLSGGDAWTVQGFHSPPWLLPFLLPLALPDSLGRGIFLALTVLVSVWALRRMGVKGYESILFLTMPLWIFEMMAGNVDWLSLLGMTLPLPIGLPLMLLKPQFALGVIVMRLWHTWKTEKGRGAMVAVAPTLVLVFLSLALFGTSWVRAFTSATASGAASLFPWGVPLGVFCMAMALWKNRMEFAYPVGPLLAPHISGYTWQVVFLSLVKDRFRMTVVWIVLWVFWFIIIVTDYSG